MIRLSNIGQNVTIKEFQGDTISQIGHYLNILDVSGKIVASLTLEPGYCLANVSVTGEGGEHESAAAEFGRTLRARAERNGHLAHDFTDSRK